MQKYQYFFLSILFIACDSESKSPTNQEAMDTSGPTDTAEVSEPETEPELDPTKVRFTGKVAYEDGTEVSNETVRIQMCAASCVRGQLTEDGGFVFSSLPADTYAFDVVPLTGAANTYASILDFITLVEGEEERVLEQVISIPNFTNSETVSESEFDASDGFIIQMKPDSFEPLDDTHTQIFSVSVDPNSSGLPFETISTGTIVKLWHLGPFDAHVENWSFRIENLDYPMGTEFQIYSSNYYGMEWTDLGSVTTDENGTIYGNDNLNILSSIILVQN